MGFSVIGPMNAVRVAAVVLAATFVVALPASNGEASQVHQGGLDARAEVASTGCSPYIYVRGLRYRKFLVLIPVNVRLTCAESRPALRAYLQNLSKYFRTGQCSGSGCTNAPSLPGWSCALAKPASRYPYVKCWTRGQEAWAIAPK